MTRNYGRICNDCILLWFHCRDVEARALVEPKSIMLFI